MCRVNIYEAKTNLSKYVEMLETGKEEEIIITRYDKVVARLTLFKNEKDNVRVGAGRGFFKDKPYILKMDDDDLPSLFGY